MELDTWSAGVSGLAATAGLFWLARQTRADTKQAEISNYLAGIQANESVLTALREVHMVLVERPGLRKYFYADGDEDMAAECPQEPGDLRGQVLTIAELLLDVLASGLDTHGKVPHSNSTEAWESYCRHMVGTSPVLRDLVREHPDWWFGLPRLLPPPQE